MIEFYKNKGYKVTHKTRFENGNKLPYNGVLEVDRRRKYLCFGQVCGILVDCLVYC